MGDVLLTELQIAFDKWGAVLNITFEQAAEGTSADVSCNFDTTLVEETAFDGPGGALANASVSGTSCSITFDANERWELQGLKHPQRQFMDWDEMYFNFLPVAIHEIGHILGLCHSEAPIDVMSPYYIRDRVNLSDNDIARVKAIYLVA